MAPRLKASGCSAAPRRGGFEHIEQVHLILWTDGGEIADRYPNARKIFAIPNGGTATSLLPASSRLKAFAPASPTCAFLKPGVATSACGSK